MLALYLRSKNYYFTYYNFIFQNYCYKCTENDFSFKCIQPMLTMFNRYYTVMWSTVLSKLHSNSIQLTILAELSFLISDLLCVETSKASLSIHVEKSYLKSLFGNVSNGFSFLFSFHDRESEKYTRWCCFDYYYIDGCKHWHAKYHFQQ